MAIHNWIRCHWRNGRHVLHDVPEAWNDEIEAHLKRHRAHVRDLGRVRTASLDAVDLAWVECEVPLGSPERDLTYRRARAVHALVRARSSNDDGWSRAEVESLLTDHYGESAEKGLATQHRVLSGLDHPHDLRNADGLFVGCESPLPSHVDVEARGGRANRDDGYAKRHLIDEWESWVAEGQHHAYTDTPRASAQQRIEPMRPSAPGSDVPRDAGDATALRPLPALSAPSPTSDSGAPMHAGPPAIEALGAMLTPPLASAATGVTTVPVREGPGVTTMSVHEAANATTVPAPMREDVNATTVPTPMREDVNATTVPTLVPQTENSTPAPLGEPPGTEATSAVRADAPLFDLSGPRRDASTAPANSLSSLLRPSYTTHADNDPGRNDEPDA